MSRHYFGRKKHVNDCFPEGNFAEPPGSERDVIVHVISPTATGRNRPSWRRARAAEIAPASVVGAKAAPAAAAPIEHGQVRVEAL
jgi:hypothetical protein